MKYWIENLAERYITLQTIIQNNIHLFSCMWLDLTSTQTESQTRHYFSSPSSRLPIQVPVHTHVHTHTHTHNLTALCPGLPGWAGTRNVKPIWILKKQETVSGSGISLAICKSAPCPRQTTMPAHHHSIFTGRMPFLSPNQQCQSTEGQAFSASVAFSAWPCVQNTANYVHCF